MFKKVKCFVAMCDGCGGEYDESGDMLTHFSTIKEAKEELKETEWEVKGKKVYCPECKNK
jgi:hypothetical protein